MATWVSSPCSVRLGDTLKGPGARSTGTEGMDARFGIIHVDSEISAALYGLKNRGLSPYFQDCINLAQLPNAAQATLPPQ